MNLYAISLLCIAFFLATINTTPLQRSRRMINGSDAKIIDYPYQTSFRYKGRHFCSGAIISDRHILTAAHCLLIFNVPGWFYNVTIHTGTSFVTELGNVHHVKRYKPDPEWLNIEATSWVNDVGVILLKEPIVFDNYQKPINLPTRDVVNGTKANVTGWGNNSPMTRPIQLQKLDATVLTSESCQPRQKKKIYSTQICANHENGIGACNGDSGSPMTVGNVAIGITSWVEGQACADGYPDVYTKVYDFLQFINTTIAELSASNSSSSSA